jgi:hypothetical protein
MTSSTDNNGNAILVLPIKPEDLTDPSYAQVSLDKRDNHVTFQTACTFEIMAAAAAKEGITLTITSGFRSLARQTEFYDCYTKDCTSTCGNYNGDTCNAAAVPGTSHHGIGKALDIDTAQSNVFPWLSAHAQVYGFSWAEGQGINEPWHWTYEGRQLPFDSYFYATGSPPPSPPSVDPPIVIPPVDVPPMAGRWGTALQNAPTNGKWAVGATTEICPNPEVNWLGGIARSETEAKAVEYKITSELLSKFRTVATEFQLPVALILGLASKESSMGNGLNAAGFADSAGNNGFGILQVDRGTNYDQLMGFPDPYSVEHIRQGVQALKENIDFFDCACGQDCESKAAGWCTPNGPEWVTNCPWEDGWKLRAALVAYNAGRAGACTKTGLDHLSFSYGTQVLWACDYSSDVIARAQYYSTKYE